MFDMDQSQHGAQYDVVRLDVNTLTAEPIGIRSQDLAQALTLMTSQRILIVKVIGQMRKSSS